MSRLTRLLVSLAVVAPLAACDVPFAGPDPGDALDDFAAALEEGMLEGADGKEFKEIVERLDLGYTVEAGDADEDGDEATGELTWRWTVGEAEWSYDTEVELARDGDEWTPVWAPTIVEPSLKEGEVLDSTDLLARRGEIVGASGVPIVTNRPVTRFGIDKTKVKAAQAPASATQLAQLLDIDAASYAKRVKDAGPEAFVEALVLREADARAVPSLDDIPGAVGLGTEIPLAPSREFAAPLLGTVGQATAELIKKSDGKYEAGDVVGLSGLQARYDDQLGGVDGLQIEAVGEKPGQERTLFVVDQRDGEPLELTLDLDLQNSAKGILADVTSASALVAIDTNNGNILAAASGPGSEGYNTATFGQYAPGSTFKSVTSLALLRSGLSSSDTLSCPSTVTVDGKSFKNYDDYPSSSIGEVPLSEAIAQSCNTALIGERDRLGDRDLANAAAALGLGVDHDLGFPAYFGQVPPPASETEAAADMIGQGKVLASPMAMATVIASISSGETVLPRLVLDPDIEQKEPKEPLTGAEAEALRGLLRGVVTSGSGSGLADIPGPPVIAKTGTAEFVADGELLTHAWMIAARGDIAVAVFVERGESGSQTAGPLLEAFLRAV